MNQDDLIILTIIIQEKTCYGSILGYPPLFPRLSLSPELRLKKGGGCVGSGDGGGGGTDGCSSGGCEGLKLRAVLGSGDGNIYSIETC